ncbi:tRNA pseudouridine(13) synthase TruD [Candidatus Bathyarchaeota archaeon]|nr:tRNA pseudouridine(13) synthase TruD [Candidatus Bathyarchaeota archaeon]
MTTEVSSLDADFGIMVYASRSLGIGGKIRVVPEDFVVEEVLIDGSKASVVVANINRPTSNPERYVICVLVKKGWDTFSALRTIARQLDIDEERISISGIKDARALTAQHISIGGVPLEKISEINLENAAIIPTRFSPEKISSKVLFGNQFDIKVRAIECSIEEAKQRIEETKHQIDVFWGVPNFFGHQRFGTIRPFTHKVGRHIVRGEYEKAALIFLSEPSVYEHRRASRARERLRETGDYKSCLRFFPRRLFYERLMLLHLSRYPNDFLGAFRKIPRTIRVLFVQAYQSYLFNRFLSERIKHGLSLNEAYPGDFVVSLDKNGLPTNNFRNAKPDESFEIREAIRRKELAIALPLVGYNQGVSKGIQGQIERQVLKEENISPKDFYLMDMPEASAAGGLRSVLIPLMNFDVTFEEDKHNIDRGNFAVRFRFMLHKGSYATVVLREFMKPIDLVDAGF